MVIHSGGRLLPFVRLVEKMSRSRRKLLTYITCHAVAKVRMIRHVKSQTHSSRGSTGSFILVHDDCRLGHVTAGTRMVLLLLPRIRRYGPSLFSGRQKLFTRASLFASHEQCSAESTADQSYSAYGPFGRVASRRAVLSRWWYLLSM